jgi:hypothetical protein
MQAGVSRIFQGTSGPEGHLTSQSKPLLQASRQRHLQSKGLEVDGRAAVAGRHALVRLQRHIRRQAAVHRVPAVPVRAVDAASEVQTGDLALEPYAEAEGAC